jgi:hypothetical protein
MSKWWCVTLVGALTVSRTGGAEAGPAVAALDLKPALGQDFAAYEVLFGKPVKQEGLPDGKGSRRLYQHQGLVLVRLTQAAGRSEVSQVELGFPKGSVKTWKSALVQVGLPTEGVTLRRSGEPFTIEGLPNGCQAQWRPNDPRTNAHILTIRPGARAPSPSAAVPPQAAPPKTQPSTEPNRAGPLLISLLSKDSRRPALEKAFGRATESGKNWTRHRLSGTEGISVFWGNPTSPVAQQQVGYTWVFLPAGTTAQQALAVLGLHWPGASLKSVNEKYQQFRYFNDPVKNWNVWYFGTYPYKDDIAVPLPCLHFEPRSINDTTPD